jgi:VWFA-related protein
LPHLRVELDGGTLPAERHMIRCLSPIIMLAALASAAVGARQTPPTAAEGTRHVYFAAVDRKGDPVVDLTTADVRVREDGAERHVVGVERATAPLHIAMLVDDSGAGLRFIREAAGAFIQRMGGHAEMSLTSTGGKNTQLVDFTARVPDLYAGVRRLVTRNTSNAVDGAYLLDGVHDAIESFTTRAPERPVILVVTLESAEFSSRRADRLLDELQASGAILHVVALGKPTLKTMSTWNEGPMQSVREGLDENMNRKKFLEDGARQSGGRLEQVLVDSGLTAALTAIADELLSQYVVVYSHRADKPVRKINISVARSGVKVRARAELPRIERSK